MEGVFELNLFEEDYRNEGDLIEGTSSCYVTLNGSRKDKKFQETLAKLHEFY